MSHITKTAKTNINIQYNTTIIIFTGRHIKECLADIIGELLINHYSYYEYPTNIHYSKMNTFNKLIINRLTQQNRKAFMICQLDEIIKSLVSSVSGVDLTRCLCDDVNILPNPYDDNADFDEMNKILKVVRFDVHNNMIIPTEYNVRDMLICYISRQEYR
jgi:hypothetical protein